MKLLLIRHAIAEEREEFARSGEPDDLRPLTAEGRKKMKRAARGLREVAADIDVLATSPLTRAAQTADVIGKEYGDLPAVTVDALTPTSDPEAFVSWLQRLDDAQCVAAVGHEPHISSLAAFLITGNGRGLGEMKKGAAMMLEFAGEIAAGAAELRWFLTPGQLRAIGD